MLTANELLGDDWLATGALADSCRYAVAQTGKQLRSRLVGEASRLGVCENSHVHTAARAVELLHIATLAHDDVIDDSPLRRGDASLDSKHGGFAAGCAGAWLFGTAVELAAECSQEAVRLLAFAACELCDGEMRETQDLYNTGRREESYFAAIAGKTASLFSLSAQLGGLTGGVSPTMYAELGRYGHLLGMAFQLADDILDLLGWDGRKRRGDDLRHGVFTLPVIYAIGKDASLRDVITHEIDDETVDAIVAGIRETGAFDRAFAVCDQHIEAACLAADELKAPWLEKFAYQALAPLDAVRGA
jgi:geranylgeranyl pyrophosphate synthase